jgi:tetratricopeptide (TPR) repeat protein
MAAQAMQYLVRYRREAIIAASCILVVIVAIVAWYLYDLSSEKAAMTLYNKAAASGKDPSQPPGQPTPETLKIYQDLVKDYSGTAAGGFAAYRLGFLHLGQGKFDEAIEAFEGYLQKHGQDNELRILVYNGLGSSYEQKKDYPKALAYFEKAAGSKAGGAFASSTHENLGRTYEAMKDTKSALEQYKKALEKAVDPAMKELLQRRIAALG